MRENEIMVPVDTVQDAAEIADLGGEAAAVVEGEERGFGAVGQPEEAFVFHAFGSLC